MTPGIVEAVVPQFRFDTFSQDDGLPNNLVQCIYQDKKGWLWIGTSQGLSRFDGYTFVNFLPDPHDSLSLPGNLVRVIKEDSRGNLLIGIENGGLNIFDREKERFTHPLSKGSNLQYRNLSVNDIEEDKSGNLWLGTDFNVLVIDSSGSIKPLEPQMVGSDQNLEGNFIRNLQFDNMAIPE